MKRFIAFAFLFALCAGATPALANDPSCVLESCEKTDIAREAAKAMSEAPGTGVTRTPPQDVIDSIEREIASEPKRSRPAPASNKNPYNQPESCDHYAESRNRFTKELLDYAAFLKEEQLRVRADVIAYGQKLKDDDAAMKVKMAEFRVTLEEDQRRQSQHHVDFQARLQAENEAVDVKAAEYGRQLAESQRLMACPPDEFYSKYVKDGYTTKWNP